MFDDQSGYFYIPELTYTIPLSKCIIKDGYLRQAKLDSWGTNCVGGVAIAPIISCAASIVGASIGVYYGTNIFMMNY